MTTRTLRFYEDKGLIAPQRSGQTRIYSGRDRARLRVILQGKNIGLTLDDIKDMLSVYDLRGGRPDELRASLAKLDGRLEFLKQRRRDVDQAITDLTQMRQMVEDLLRPHKI